MGCQAPELLAGFWKCLLWRKKQNCFHLALCKMLSSEMKALCPPVYVVWWHSSHQHTEKLETPYELLMNYFSWTNDEISAAVMWMNWSHFVTHQYFLQIWQHCSCKLLLLSNSAETAILTVLMAFTVSSRAAHLSPVEDLGILFNVLPGSFSSVGYCER